MSWSIRGVPVVRRHRGRAAVVAVAAAVSLATVALTGCGPAAKGASTPPDSSTPSTSSPTAPTSSPPTPTSTTTTTTTPPMRWSACTAASGPTGLQCATLEVPLDYADPARGTIGIALDRHRATGHRIGSLLMDPGGPGVSGVDYLPALLTQMPSGLTDAFDIVGFDPRGVGRSDPVTCGTGPQLDSELSVDPAPPTAAGLGALLAADRRFAAGCDARSHRVLPFVSTADAARDMDRIRAALGDRRLTYLGFSYGTLLGATYARLFPTHIRAMVLDGALDPALGIIPTVEAQSAALDRELDAFFASCAAGRCGWRPSDDLHAAFDQLVARVRARPVAVANTGRSVGPAVLLYGAASDLYSPASWPALGQALTDLQSGDGSQILAMFDDYMGRNTDGTYANTVEAETAVDCLDAPAPAPSQIEAAATATERAAPVFGLLDLYSELSCSVWPVASTGHPAPVRAAGSPPIVVVGSTGDPVTPYVWARALASQLQHGVLLTRTGFGHTGYAFSSCVRADVDRYLLTVTPPRPGTTCPSD